MTSSFYKNQSDQAQTRLSLLSRLKNQSNEEAWEEFTEIYRPYLYRVIQNLNVRHEDIEDILQNIIVIAWEKLPEFKYDPHRGRFRSWLATVTRRDAIRYLKKQQAKKEVHLDPEIEHQLDCESEIDKMIENEWEQHLSELAWKRLELQFSEKVLLCFKDLATGMSGEEVSKKYDLSPNSVYVYKKRVLTSLQKEMALLEQF